jgi:hypothetical protein
MPESTKPASKNKQYTSDSPAGLTAKLGMKIGKIVRVRAEKNTADLEWLWPIRGGNGSVKLSRPYVGLRSGINFIPEVGSQVIVGYSKDEIVLLSYLMPSDFDQLIAGATDNKGIPTRMRVMNPGEISLSSSDNSEIYLRDILELHDSKNNKITIDPTFGITASSTEFTVNNEAGQLFMGLVRRNSPYAAPEIVTDDGLPIPSFNGGNALTEVTLNVKRTADGSDLTNNDATPNIAKITVGNLVDENGNKVVNQINKEIVCEIKIGEKKDPTGRTILNPGMKIQIDIDGNYNINGGNMLSPLEQIPATAIRATLSIQKKKSDYKSSTYTTQSKQNAARVGDTIKIPLSPFDPDIIEHPGLLKQGGLNAKTLITWFPSSCHVMGIPVIFLPTPAELVGQIMTGADGVFIGDKPKTLP